MNENRKIIIAAGGTGGHIYPALAVAQTLSERLPGAFIEFAAGKLDSNPFFVDSLFPSYTIACGNFSTKNPYTLAKSGLLVLKGIADSYRYLRKVKPDIVIGFGSYHTFPILVAAKMAGFPIVLHESNSIPGKVNRLMAPYAIATGIQFPHAAGLLKGVTLEVGMPLRPGYRPGSISKSDALDYFGLKEGKLTVLVFGGSQGAQTLNRIAVEAIEPATMQVVHIAGTRETAEELRRNYLVRGITACVKQFEKRMDYAWQAADCALVRAGAGTIAEALAFQVPCILVPYPYAADNHQAKNAEFLTNTIGGGFTIGEKELDAARLRLLLKNMPLETMRKAMQRYQGRGKITDFSTLVESVILREFSHESAN